MKLLEAVSFQDPYCRSWVAPVGSVVDGASIPQFAWSIIGGPFEGKYRDASVIHDVACVEKTAPWEYVHLAFYYAMLANEVDPLKAKIMYAAVYHFGPRWAPPGSKGSGSDKGGEGVQPPKSPLTIKDFDTLRIAIENGEATAQPMSLTDIQGFGPR